MNTLELQKHLIAFAVLHGGLGDYGTRADGRRDDDGVIGNRTLLAMADYRVATGTVALMQPELHSHLRATIAEVPADAPLGIRALGFALREWCAGIREEPPGSNTGPRIRDYFKVCDRKGVPIKTRAGEWCAAAASWCTKMALRPDEPPPHGFRIGGAELEGDLKRGEYAGRWVPVEAVRAGQYSPRPGDLVILDRSGGWTRHVCRLVAFRGDWLWTIGGNESNAWRLTPRRLAGPKLLGFGAYPTT